MLGQLSNVLNRIPPGRSTPRVDQTAPTQRGITGIETAIIMISMVVVASIFAFATLTTGTFAAQEGKKTDLPQIVVPVAMLVPDASSEVCARHRDVVCPGQSSQLVLVADSPTNCAA